MGRRCVDVAGGRRGPRAHAAVLTVAAAASIYAAVACANTRFNTIAPGAEPRPTVVVPDAIELVASGYDVHLDPTVMLWARDAKVDLRTIVRDAVERASAALRGPPAAISISAGSYRVIPDVGIGGSTDARTGEVIVSMDARSPVGLRELLSTWLPIVLAHELHHSVRVLDGPGYGTTLRETIASEGAAEAFVREAYPDAPSIPWVSPLSRTAQQRVWREARDALDERDDAEAYERWFLGAGDLPRWTGYRLGYAIARAYLSRHADTNAAELARLDAGEIFDGSGYDPA